MAEPSLVVRVAANLQELRQNLAEGKNQIETTTAAMQKLSTSFSGDRIIQSAHNVTAAVQNIGGASRLTEAEQARVNRTVSAAIQKYEAMGREAPAAMRKLQDETAKAAQKTNLFAEAAKLAFAAFSTRAVVGAIGDTITFGSKMSDLAAKTGMTAEALQRMAFAAGQSGVPVERLTDGIVQLAKRLVEGDRSATAAVKALGLDFKELIDAGPEEALYRVGEAVAAIPNPMERAAVATGLFGRTGADFLPAFTANMAQVADEAQRAGKVLGEDTINALDAADDAFAALKVSVTALAGNALAPFVPLIADVAKWLGDILPASLKAAQDGFSWLIEKGLAAKVWLMDFTVGIAEAVAAVPVLGRVFGETAGDLDAMRASAQGARDHLEAFRAQGVEPARVATEAARPSTIGYGEALRGVATAAREVKATTETLAPRQEAFHGLVSRSLAETGKLTRQLEAWARTNSAMLTPSIQQVNAALSEQNPLVSTMQAGWAQFAPTVQQNTIQAQGGISGFFSQVFGGAQELGQSVSNIFQAAFTGGGGALGAVKAFATQTLSSLMAMIPGIGPFVSAFAGPIVAMFSRLTAKAKDFFRTLFGGPSRGELNDRSLVADFEDEVIAALSAQQQAEAGGERWKQVVIGIRDAYMAAGRTAAEAEADVARLWASSREGGEETWRVMDEIKRKMQEQATAASDGIDRIGTALDNLPDVVNIEIKGNYHTYGEVPGGYADGTMGRHGHWFRDFGGGTPTVLHGREAVVTPEQAPAFARSVLGGGEDMGAMLMRDLPRMLKLAFREAMAGA